MENLHFFDSHAHYDHPLFEGRGEETISEWKERGLLGKVVIPGITYESNFNREEYQNLRDTVYFAPGLHPKYATNEPMWDTKKKQEFLTLLEDERTVALKSGLDFCKKNLTDSQKEHQKEFLHFFLQLSEERKLPLVLHAREALEELYFTLGENAPKNGAVVHCWNGDYQMAEKLMGVGVTHFGIGGMVSRDGMEDLRDCVQKLDLANLLLETDAPFVRPKGYEGKVNQSANLIVIAQIIADLKKSSVEQVIAHTYDNAMKFYRLDQNL